mmetsp:Transcript_50672/g.146114  ORF Transcript_50672/g.146114 Transcript_50672/m.146114 type:complete len:299 (-) Transcript_50672:836-1732(-)
MAGRFAEAAGHRVGRPGRGGARSCRRRVLPRWQRSTAGQAQGACDRDFSRCISVTGGLDVSASECLVDSCSGFRAFCVAGADDARARGTEGAAIAEAVGSRELAATRGSAIAKAVELHEAATTQGAVGVRRGWPGVLVAPLLQQPGLPLLPQERDVGGLRPDLWGPRGDRQERRRLELRAVDRPGATALLLGDGELRGVLVLQACRLQVLREAHRLRTVRVQLRVHQREDQRHGSLDMPVPRWRRRCALFQPIRQPSRHVAVLLRRRHAAQCWYDERGRGVAEPHEEGAGGDFPVQCI